MHSYIIIIKGEKLPNVYNYIKEISNGWWKHMPSSIIVRYEGKCTKLKSLIIEKFKDEIDSLVVLEATGNASWIGIKQSGGDWIKRYL